MLTIYRLQQISPEVVVNTMLVGYFDEATAGFDKNYDAELFSSPNDVIYSVLNNLKLLNNENTSFAKCHYGNRNWR